MLKRHFKDQLFLLLCHWDVPMPIQQKCSFHFHKHDENTISSKICTLQVLLINLYFKECKRFIWKKKKTDDTKAEFNYCFDIYSKQFLV